jgi:hypothetical protein
MRSTSNFGVLGPYGRLHGTGGRMTKRAAVGPPPCREQKPLPQLEPRAALTSARSSANEMRDFLDQTSGQERLREKRAEVLIVVGGGSVATHEKEARRKAA